MGQKKAESLDYETSGFTMCLNMSTLEMEGGGGGEGGRERKGVRERKEEGGRGRGKDREGRTERPGWDRRILLALLTAAVLPPAMVAEMRLPQLRSSCYSHSAA